jgi:hypothetical protein
MRMLDLESDLALIELLKARLCALEFEAADIQQHAIDVGAPEVADRLSHLVRDIFRTQAIPDMMASRAPTLPRFCNAYPPKPNPTKG